jgi:hypothetical protein
VELETALEEEDGGRLDEDPFASRVQVFTSCTTSCPFASLTGVNTITQVTVMGPNGLTMNLKVRDRVCIYSSAR